MTSTTFFASSEKTFEDFVVRFIETFGLAYPAMGLAVLLGVLFFVGKWVGERATTRNVEAQTGEIKLRFEKEIEQKTQVVTEVKKMTGLQLREARDAVKTGDVPKLVTNFDELTYRISNEFLPALGTLCAFAGSCLDRGRLSQVAETDVLPGLLHLHHLLAMLNNEAVEKKFAVKAKFLIREQSVEPLVRFVDMHLDKRNSSRVAEFQTFRENIGRYYR